MKNIFYLLLFIIFLSNSIYAQVFNNLNASFQSNSNYYLDDNKTGDFNYENRFRSNNYLNFKSTVFEKIDFEIQIESYLPAAVINYSPNLKKTNVSTFNFKYNTDKLNITLGNFYEQFGSGIILRTWEDKNLGINNSIRGGRIRYFINDGVNVTALFGNQKKGFKYSKGYLMGIDSEFDLSSSLNNNTNTLIIGISYLGRNDGTPTTNLYGYKDLTNLFSTRIDFSSTNFYSNFEVVSKSKDAIVQFGDVSTTFIKNGSSLLFNSGYIKNGLGIDFTFRRIENMSLFSERRAFGNIYFESVVNYLPALTKQHDYSLTNIYVYQSQPNISFQDPKMMKSGEIGFQFDLFYFLEQNSFLGGKYGTNVSINASIWNNLKGDYDYYKEYVNTNLFGFGEKYFSEFNIEIRKKWSKKFESIFLFLDQYYNKKYIEEKYGEIKSSVFVLDNTYKINNKKSLRFELQHLNSKDDNKNWAAIGLEYNFNYALSLYVMDTYNYGNPIKEDKMHYYNTGISYNKGNSRYSLNYGRQRGGYFCYGGICRYVPDSTGFSFGVTKSLF